MEGLDLDLFFVQLFDDDGGDDVAAAVLRGDPICIVPFGKFYREGRWRDVTTDVVNEFVDNWQHRTSRGIRRRRLAVDVDHDRRAIGWYTDIMALPTGLGATFKFNKRGRQVLEGGEYAYFSPAVYWRVVDHKTAQVVEHQIAGGALTNYPFFGEETSLHSMDGVPLLYAVTKTEGGVEYPSRAYLVVEDPEKPTTWHLRVMSWQGGELKADRRLMGAAKAALTSPGGHRGNRYEGPQKEAATRKLRTMYEREGMKFSVEGGTIMPDQQIDNGQSGQGVINLNLPPAVADLFDRLSGLLDQAEGGGGGGDPDLASIRAELATLTESVASFADVSGQLETLTEQRDQFAERVTGLETRLAAEQATRLLAEYTAMAQTEFSHLPGTATDLAGHLLWLAGADTEDARPHFTFFTNLLRQADQWYEEAFSRRGFGGGNNEADASVLSQVHTLATQYMAEHDGVEYQAAVSEIFAQNPRLYEQYSQAIARAGGGE